MVAFSVGGLSGRSTTANGYSRRRSMMLGCHEWCAFAILPSLSQSSRKMLSFFVDYCYSYANERVHCSSQLPNKVSCGFIKFLSWVSIAQRMVFDHSDAVLAFSLDKVKGESRLIVTSMASFYRIGYGLRTTSDGRAPQVKRWQVISPKSCRQPYKGLEQ
jgi:hypothetical protein